jgi:hypothetical protein
MALSRKMISLANCRARLAEPETKKAAGSFVPHAGRIRPTYWVLSGRFPGSHEAC